MCKPVQVVRLVADGQMYKHPCLLWFVHVTPKENKRCNVYLHDGFGTGDRIIMDVGCPSNATTDFTPARPIRCSQGIYADFGNDVVECVVGFEPLPEA